MFYKFAVLMACFNRVDKTLRCLQTLTSGVADAAEFSVDIFLADDGSTDGTSEQVRLLFPQVNIISGSGSMYWAGGMRAAWAEADRKGLYDFVVWVNDDVEFFPAAVKSSFERAVQLKTGGCSKPTILVGSIVDPDSGEIAYSGVNRPSPVFRPLYFDRVYTPGVEVECETFNGNFVIIPAAVVETIGGMNPGYIHAFGDYDYGFRARQDGFKCTVLANPVGSCSRNPWVAPAKIRSMSLLQRWRRMTGPKLYPLRGWFTYASAHTGIFWPFYFLRPYWEVLFRWAFSRLR